MSAVCILAPIVVAAWPGFSAAVVAAATSLGYSVISERRPAQESSTRGNTVNLEIANSEVVTNQLGRDQRISVSRQGVTVSFYRDARGKAALCVTGTDQSQEALRVLGEELSQRVVQQYVYRRLLDEMQARQFMVVNEEVDENQTIRLKVRMWEN